MAANEYTYHEANTSSNFVKKKIFRLVSPGATPTVRDTPEMVLQLQY
jgi:hypothetical protein